MQTMRAAIEAAGAADHKRRAKRTRSAAAQTILDSGFGQAKVTVTAVGVGGDGCSLNGEDGDTDAAKGNGSAAGNPDGSYDSGGYYRFGRVRRVAAALLRDLGTVVDARQYGVASSGSYIPGMSNSEGGNGDDGADGNVTCSGGGGGGGGARMRDRLSGYVDADGVNKLVERFELLEDEVASASARRAQSEAQAKVLLATLQKANTRADRRVCRLCSPRMIMTGSASYDRVIVGGVPLTPGYIFYCGICFSWQLMQYWMCFLISLTTYRTAYFC